ncbi:PREDICTED: conserved oligomeric Golgi complex subunit 5-like [Wasmannia auropunctata]|uniref:conserved oligomeric Golgi complex subunit 5-like n=2 Tax=Wasmannia auropunctata TaxID=64793 RepID=UPI0005F08FC1|nr:PREDICTED: conserved oligomeric Golgi complex subunit 5-like [Wasmannia auropunctata]XP_011685987.1 PREDICTED: conserved oligomeric Golgi complex subunit 5-like [Wasmannia auropunctata]
MSEISSWEDIENNQFFKQLLDTDSKKTDVSPLLSVAQQLNKLGQAIEVLNAELQRQVLLNHEDLLSQATWVEKLEGVLFIMQSHIQSLLSAVERLRGKIIDPFNRIEMQTIVLARLHETSDLLRRVSRMQHLSKRLNSQMSSITQGPDIVKAANSLHELEQLMADTDLNGLDVIADDQQAIKTQRATVQRIATHTLTQGLQAMDRTKVSTAVQVFQNLGIIDGAVDTTIESTLAEIERISTESLDVSLVTNQDFGKRGAPGRAAIPSPGSSGNLRTRIWENLERLFQDTLYTQCLQIELLQRVLLEHHMKGFHDLSEKFWDKVNTLLAKVLIERAQGSSFVKQALEGEYPKFLRIFLDLSKRLKERSHSIGIYGIDRNVLLPFENAYLSRSVSRLLDPVHNMFSGEGLPTHDEIDSLIRMITNELSVSLVDDGLSTVVSRNVGKAIRLFCLKCEQSVVTGGEASQVIDSPTTGQQTNVTLANLLHYLSSQTNRVIANLAGGLPNEGSVVITTALKETDELTKTLLAPLLTSISDAIESIILTMHDDPEFRDTSSPLGKEIGCSLYMRELQGFILRSVNTFLLPYKNQVVVAECCKAVASRCIELFVRHACLLRPLTDFGKAKLLADFAQMEVAVTPLCRGGQMGLLEQQQYRTLRALKTLLPLTPDEMVDKILEGQGESGVSPSLILLHLFSGAPPELASPHQSAGWSVGRLSQWMDGHPNERDRLALCSGPLERYQLTVRQQNLPSFHPLFPHMMKLANLREHSSQ